ncbi:MAG: 5-deoxy-glucuronate isomerase [Acidimicrobiales bacterium]
MASAPAGPGSAPAGPGSAPAGPGSGPAGTVGPAGRGHCHKKAGSLARGQFALELTAEDAGWSWSSLRVVEIAQGAACTIDTGGEEMLVLPLAGSCTVSPGATGGVRYALTGRTSPFAGPSDACYLPCATTAVIESPSGGRFALPGAKATSTLPPAYVPVESVPVELRGAGSCSRRVANVCFPGNVEAERLIVCEVLTPAGNWSSYPPHKHDEERDGETELEELYYFEVAPGAGPDRAHHEGVAFQRVYGTAERPIEVLAEVRDRDVVLVPHGWHGPTMAAPGYDLYYLNVMAGPGRRAWLACDDPAHAWVRETWVGQDVDPRLLGGPAGGGTGSGT